MGNELTSLPGIDIYSDYQGMVFWGDAVVYLHQRFADFDPSKLLVQVDEQTLFCWKVAYSYDKRNWSEPKELSKWATETQYMAMAEVLGDMRQVYLAIWAMKEDPNHMGADTLYVTKGTDTRTPILRIGAISYAGAPIAFNDESVANVVPFYEMVSKFPKWSFYDNQEVNIRRWLDMCWSTIYSYGHVCIWFKTMPSETSNTLANNMLRNVVAIKRIMVASPGNEIPSEKQVYTEWDMPLMDDFVIHVVNEAFKETFGPNAVPLQKDYLYIPMLDRIFKVSNVQPGEKRFMGKVGWWECYLAKYEEDSTVTMAPGLAQTMQRFPGMEEAMSGFNIVEELEQFLDDTVLSEEEIGELTDDEKKAVNDNFSNRLVDSTGYVDLKDTEAQRAAYSTRLGILTVNPDGNALFPVNMYNCGGLGPREVAMTYDLADYAKVSGDSLKVTQSLEFGFDFVAQGKFNGELFDLAPSMTVSFSRALQMTVTFQGNQAVKKAAYVFVVGDYYRIEASYTTALNQLSLGIFQLTNGQKLPVYQDIYIVNGGLSGAPFGVAPTELILYGGSWLAGNIFLGIDSKTIVNDRAIPVLVMNKFGL